MNKSSTDILNEKVELIYEYDNKSPLFVRVANVEIERNNFVKAIDILNKGLELYPNYAAAYMILGKAFLLKGDYENADECFKNGSDLLHSPKSYSAYLKDLDLIKKQRSPFQNVKDQSFVKALAEKEAGTEAAKEFTAVNPLLDNDLSFDDDVFKKNKEKLVENTERELNDDDGFDIENRLDEIAQNLSGLKIKNTVEMEPDAEDLPGENDSKIIPSETLAKIYISQGEFKEAIEVYKELIILEPAKKLYYASRIREIEDQLDVNQF